MNTIEICFKIGVVKQLYADGLLTKEQKEKAIELIRKEAKIL